MFDVMEGIINFLLNIPKIFQSERDFLIRKCAPGTKECGFMLMCWENVGMIIAGESIHKLKYIKIETIISNLFDECGGIIVLRTRIINVLQILWI